MHQVLTANSLRDGRVVFLSHDQRWVTELDKAQLASGDSEAEELTKAGVQAEADGLVIASYLIDVELQSPGLVKPSSLKERIRAFGPTVQTENN